MPIQYPTKYPDSKNLDIEMENICECGHADFEHEFKGKECRTCTCPIYKFEQQLTKRQAVDLAIFLLQKNSKQANTN